MFFPVAHKMRRVLRPYGVTFASTALLVMLAAACGSDGPASDTSTRAATPGLVFTTGSGETANLTIEVADTPEQRSRGLMGRESLPEDAGMLFVWQEDRLAPFSMKGTPVPLSIAFIDAAGIIVDIQDMKPLDETLYYGTQPHRYAVEANQGWFAEHGITVGDRVRLPESVATPEG